MTAPTVGQRVPHPHRATIAPVAAGVVRPLWSVMIPHFNSAHFLAQTLESVLAQDPGPDVMQIEVVDDHSTRDDPEPVVRDVGRGRVGFHRQPQNVRHVRNFATCLARSRGTLVHLLHGDDFVLPGFYRAMGAAFARAPEIGLATCRHHYALADGTMFGTSPVRRETAGRFVDGFYELAVIGNLQTPAVVVRRECYETLGGFDDRLLCTEDYEMWARIASAYPVWYEPETLAVYRFHGGSNTARDAATAENIRDMRRAVAIITEELPPPAEPGWQRTVERRTARLGLDRYTSYLSEFRISAAWSALREVLRTDAGPSTLGYVVVCTWRAARLALRRIVRGKNR
jgi:GT2 family glycosyltransferase